MPLLAWQMLFPLPFAWNLLPVFSFLLLPITLNLSLQRFLWNPDLSLGHFAPRWLMLTESPVPFPSKH